MAKAQREAEERLARAEFFTKGETAMFLSVRSFLFTKVPQRKCENTWGYFLLMG